MNGRDISWVSLEFFHPQNMEGQLIPLLTARKGAQPCRYDQVGRFPHLQSLFWVVLFSVVFLFHAGQEKRSQLPINVFAAEKET